MKTALQALRELREGNKRFVSGARRGRDHSLDDRRSELADGQAPFAIVLGCSDSRVPAEIVFDQGLGDLFVIRVAGNVVAPSQIGSVEFAATQFATRLVVVLGHTRCGAVAATLDELEQPSASRSPNLAAIVDLIRPAIEPLVAAGGEDLEHRAIRANVHAAADRLRRGSTLLEGLCQNAGLLIVGAEYALETGEVTFFDGVPGEDSD